MVRVTGGCEAHENNQDEGDYAHYKQGRSDTHVSRSELYGGEGLYTCLRLYPSDGSTLVSTPTFALEAEALPEVPRPVAEVVADGGLAARAQGEEGKQDSSLQCSG